MLVDDEDDSADVCVGGGGGPGASGTAMDVDERAGRQNVFC